jgi:hypothetical protein
MSRTVAVKPCLLPDGTIPKYVFNRDDYSVVKCLDIEHQVLLALEDYKKLVMYYSRQERGLVFQLKINGDLRHYYFSDRY